MRLIDRARLVLKETTLICDKAESPVETSRKVRRGRSAITPEGLSAMSFAARFIDATCGLSEMHDGGFFSFSCYMMSD